MATPGILARLFLVCLALDSTRANGPSAVVLLGPSGSGKSETGNTLLGENRFAVSAGLESETRQPQAGLTVVEGRKWQVVDTPGYLDTSLTAEEVADLFAQFADVVSDNIAALVFVVPYGRFGDAHMRAWRLSRSAFGGPALKYIALAFTNCGDRSEADVRSDIKKLCEKEKPPAVCEVVGQLEDTSRVISFGKLEPGRRALDRSRLFDLAASIEVANGGRGYNHNDFRRTHSRRKLLAKRVEAIESAEDRRLLGLLLANVESGAQTDEDLLHALELAEGLGETRRVMVDFEDRTLGPFYQVGNGWRQPMPVPYDSMKGYSTGGGTGGRLFLHTGTDSGVRLRHGDRRSGELRTDPFFLGSGDIAWEYTGAGGLVALCPADQSDLEATGATACLQKRLRRESQVLARGSLNEDELLHLRGAAVYLRIVDDRTNGWGFVALDNIVYPSVVLPDTNRTEASSDAVGTPPTAAPDGTDRPPAASTDAAADAPGENSAISPKRRLASEGAAESGSAASTTVGDTSPDGAAVQAASTAEAVSAAADPQSAHAASAAST